MRGKVNMTRTKLNIPCRPFFCPKAVYTYFEQECKLKTLECILGNKLVEFAKKITAELDITYLEVLEALKTIGREPEEIMEKILLIVSVKKIPLDYVYQKVKKGKMA
jgi:hypothetical protein